MRRIRSGEMRVGPLIVLAVVAVAAIAFWVYKGKSEESPNNWVKKEDSFLLWCNACKKEKIVAGLDAKNIAKQGEKLQCPECKKFEGQWGRPAATPTATGSSTVMQP